MRISISIRQTAEYTHKAVTPERTNPLHIGALEDTQADRKETKENVSKMCHNDQLRNDFHRQNIDERDDCVCDMCYYLMGMFFSEVVIYMSVYVRK